MNTQTTNQSPAPCAARTIKMIQWVSLATDHGVYYATRQDDTVIVRFSEIFSDYEEIILMLDTETGETEVTYAAAHHLDMLTALESLGWSFEEVNQ